MATIPVHSLTSLDGTHVYGTWEVLAAQRNSVLDMSNPRHPRHIILDSSGIVVTRPGEMPVHLPLSHVIKAAIVANPKMTSAPHITEQPKSISCKAGESAAFFVIMVSPEIELSDPQWEALTKGAKEFSALVGENKYTLTLTANADMNGNQYRCVAKSLAGQTISKSATLTVI